MREGWRRPTCVRCLEYLWDDVSNVVCTFRHFHAAYPIFPSSFLAGLFWIANSVNFKVLHFYSQGCLYNVVAHGFDPVQTLWWSWWAQHVLLVSSTNCCKWRRNRKQSSTPPATLHPYMTMTAVTCGTTPIFLDFSMH